MTRIFLGGEGEPIPELAMPDISISTDLVPLIVAYDATGNIRVADYTDMGYTHYEAYCVGAAGGRGGDSSTGYSQGVVNGARIVLNNTDWNRYLAMVQAEDDQLSGQHNHMYVWSDGTIMTMSQRTAHDYPNHDPLVLQTYSVGELATAKYDLQYVGGGGGGGGMHKVTGRLSDLPALVPIVVGAPGVDASLGHIHQHGAWTPDPRILWAPYADTQLKQDQDYFTLMSQKFPAPKTFQNPQVGGDGGATIFNGGQAQASGGKGGAPGVIWDASVGKFVWNGYGGEGGLGGRTAAGGGAAGSTSDQSSGNDGVWDGTIGAGGGGGRGGGYTPAGGAGLENSVPEKVYQGSNGGQGSYSYADPSVYGARDIRSPYMTTAQGLDSSHYLTPGGGGGARPSPILKYGSKAPGYLPKGVVVLRLLKIV